MAAFGVVSCGPAFRDCTPIAGNKDVLGYNGLANGSEVPDLNHFYEGIACKGSALFLDHNDFV